MASEIDGAGPVVVGLPAEIDMQNADEVRDQLCAAGKPGIAVVVADLSSTWFCDSAGIREIVHGLRRLAGVGVELRLVIPPGNVRRGMELIGLDQAVTVWSSVAAAVEGGLTGVGTAQWNRPGSGGDCAAVRTVGQRSGSLGCPVVDLGAQSV